MRVVFTYKGVLSEEMDLADDIVVGRQEGGVDVDLDLRFDRLVSHRHARLWRNEGRCWIEDLGSRNGTLLNGVALAPGSQKVVEAGDRITIGETVIQLSAESELSTDNDSSNITLTLNATHPVYVIGENNRLSHEHHLAILYDLPLNFGSEVHIDALLAMVVRRLVEAIHGGSRAAIVLKDPLSDSLRLKAHVPPGKPAVSMTLAQRALRDQVAVLWQPSHSDPNSTQALESVDCAIYAPLLWRGHALGVICVDNYRSGNVFGKDDLKLVVAIAQHAALAVANQTLQEELRRESTAKANLLRQFPPKIAERLLKHRGHFPSGGERGDVTILFADIRGFSKLSKSMEPEDVVELLNSYFAALTQIVFSHDGTVIQYVGDTVLAVFGSPEPDPMHYEKAVFAALDMQKRIDELSVARTSSGRSGCSFGIGVHCGEVVNGFLGVSDFMGFTVVGDAVIRAARFCAGAKAGAVLISPELYERVWRIIREAEPVTVDAKFEERLPAFQVKSLWTQ
jgi:adenylate cyclase